jgi:capsular exopolysaccharide synthesis family protein
MLRVAVSFAVAVYGGNCKIIGVTSPLSTEGKSITCINLALAFAMANFRVLIVDCDLRRPNIANLLDITSSLGISNVLAGICEKNEALCEITHDGVRLDVISSGDIPPNPSELLGSKIAEKVFGSLAKKYDYIFVDLPPVLPVSDAVAVSRRLSGLVMMIRAGQTKRDDVRRSLERLNLAGANVLGFVLNGVQRSGSKRYYSGKYSGYEYKSEGKSKDKSKSKVKNKVKSKDKSKDKNKDKNGDKSEGASE